MTNSRLFTATLAGLLTLSAAANSNADEPVRYLPQDSNTWGPKIARMQTRAAILRQRRLQRRLKMQTAADAAAVRQHYESIMDQQIARDQVTSQRKSLRTRRLNAKRGRAHRPDPQRGTLFDESTGTVAWPSIFDATHFAQNRARLDALFNQRLQANVSSGNRASGLASRNQVEVRRAVAAMKRQLKPMARDLGSSAYIAAKRFLDSLAFEAQFAVPAQGNLAAKGSRKLRSGRNMIGSKHEVALQTTSD